MTQDTSQPRGPAVRRCPRKAFGLIVVAALTGCSGQPAERSATPSSTSVTVSSPTASPPEPAATVASFPLDGCPVLDPAACALAADVATALVAGDAARITALSRAIDFVCDEEPDLPLPACTPGAVLTGHPMIDSRPVIEVLDDAAYGHQNSAVLGGIDPAYTDEHGAGSMQVLGVGTCGPDIPERRSYHVAFTAGVRADGATERLVGSYELNLLDGEWLIGTAFLDAYDAWLTAYQDPLRQVGCNPARWR